MGQMKSRSVKVLAESFSRDKSERQYHKGRGMNRLDTSILIFSLMIGLFCSAWLGGYDTGSCTSLSQGSLPPVIGLTLLWFSLWISYKEETDMIRRDNDELM